LDEALLEKAEAGRLNGGVLRLWESPTPVVVVGRSSRLEVEVNLQFCRQRGIPVLRRSSGGAAVLAGPGCLMYAVVLGYEEHPALRAIDRAHQFVMDRLLQAVQPFVPGARRDGICDLTIEGRKFSGNSLRCKMKHLLYHGTILYDFPLELMEQCLRIPDRQPEYRAQRPHLGFVTNVPVAVEDLRLALIQAWEAHSLFTEWPRSSVEELARTKYSQAAWNAKL
jgi:lipoate-protein ligase A